MPVALRIRTSIAFAAVPSQFLTSSALAVNAIVGSGGIEVEGFAGRYQIPYSGTGTPSSGSLLGLTSDGNDLVYLSSDPSDPSRSIVRRYSFGGYFPTSTIAVNRRLDDIALTSAGTLYGVVHRDDGLQIVSINPDGSAQDVLTYPASVAVAGTWRLSGQVGPGIAAPHLLVVRAGPHRQPAAAIFAADIDPAAGMIASYTLPGGTTAYPLADTVMSADAAKFSLVLTRSTSSTNVTQPQYSLDNAAPAGTLAGADRYRSAIGGPDFVSDEFSFPANAFYLALATTSVLTGPTWGTLVRRPGTWTDTASVSLANGFTPDDTAVDHVTAQRLCTADQPAMKIVETFAAPGPFSGRSVGLATFSLDLTTAPRGVYSATAASGLTGDYHLPDGTTESRPISLPPIIPSTLRIAYDPVSDNVIGNGDFSLAGFGWKEGYGLSDDDLYPFGVASEGNDAGVAKLMPSPTLPKTLRQILQLPTPDSEMLLKFRYRLDDFYSTGSGTAILSVRLNDIVLATVPLATFSKTYSDYEILLVDPALRNLSDAEFCIVATAMSNDAFIYLDDLSLTAVPEPNPLVVSALILFQRIGRPPGRRRDG